MLWSAPPRRWSARWRRGGRRGGAVELWKRRETGMKNGKCGASAKKKEKRLSFSHVLAPPLLRSARRHYVSLIKGTARCSMKNFLRNLRDEKIARFEAIVNASWSPLSLLFYNFIIIALSLSKSNSFRIVFSISRHERIRDRVSWDDHIEGIFLSFRES